MDKVVRLVRFEQDQTGTVGLLHVPGLKTPLFTIENPWLDNESRVSCIPKGKYKLTKGRFNRGGYESLLVNDVEGREHIKFHVANTSRDVHGCIGPGLSYGKMNKDLAVFNSKIAHFQRLIPAAYKIAPATLDIREVAEAKKIKAQPLKLNKVDFEKFFEASE